MGLATVTQLPVKKTWKILNYAEWREKVPPATRWIIPGFLASEALVMMSGQQKLAWKTWTADTLAVSVSTGKAVGPFEPLEAVPVLYFQEEGTHQGTKMRLDGIANTWGIDPRSLTNLHFVFHERLKLDVEDWKLKVVGAIRHLGIKLLILDAITYMHLADENKTSEMGKVVDTLQLCKSLGTTVLWLAHLDKDRGSKRKADIDTQPRGSSLVVNAYDYHFALRRYNARDAHIDLILRAREQEERHYCVTWDIVKHNEKVFDEHLGKDVDVEVIDKAALALREVNEEPAQDKEGMLDKFAKMLAPGKEYSANELRSEWSCSATTCKWARAKLLEQEVLVLKNGKYALKPQGEGQK